MSRTGTQTCLSWLSSIRASTRFDLHSLTRSSTPLWLTHRTTSMLRSALCTDSRSRRRLPWARWRGGPRATRRPGGRHPQIAPRKAHEGGSDSPQVDAVRHRQSLPTFAPRASTISAARAAPSGSSRSSRTTPMVK